jgi:sterol desaturase/sphingolipid hydroxylase (fatty acid hydroxylase superfamily)
MALNPILFAVPVFFGLIGLEIWVARARGHAVYRLNDALGSLSLGVLSEVTGFFAKAATFGIYILAYNHLAIFTIPTSSWIAWPLALIGYDFCYYWLHRMGHEVNVLWAAHVVHHSSEEYNLTTALRQTASGFLLGWVFYLPLAIIGVPPLMFAIVGLIDLLYQFWIHTREIDRLGWFDKVFASPSNHRVHHGQNDYCIDRNYGGLLMIWDHLFGTFVDERPDEKIIYGIRGALQTFDPIEANLSVYKKLWRETQATPGFWRKIRIWLRSPSAVTQSTPEIFEPARFQLFDPAASLARRVIGAGEFLILYLMGVHFLLIADSANPLVLLAECALIAIKGLSFGRVFDGQALRAVIAIGWACAATAVLFAAAPDYWPMGLLAIAWAVGTSIVLATDEKPLAA